jgi:beta-galactosidase
VGCDRIAANLTGRELATPPEFLALLDVVGYNYWDRRNKRAETYCTDDRHDFPQRKFIGTENAGMDGIRGDYSDYIPLNLRATWKFPYGTRRNRRLDVEQMWKWIKINDWVTGDHTQCGVDYLNQLGRPTPGGILDTCGFTKDGYYFYLSPLTNKTVLHMFPHWNWKGKEGELIPVLCYTNCDTVELFLNGKSVGVQGYWFPRVGYWPLQGEGGRSNVLRTTSDLHLTWTVPYQPGTLKAVGTKDGKVVAEVEVSTTGERAAIELSVDRDAMAADRQDVAHFTVKMLDAQGRVVPTAGNDVTFEIQGEGKIIGWTAEIR